MDKFEGGFRFSIDRGGTFTDIYAEIPKAPGFRVLKLLSVDPSNYSDAPREGIRRILQEVTGKSIPRTEKVPTENIEWIRMGTTVATNALLERKGERVLLLTTHGFKDLLKIGNQTRPKIFDLQIDKPELLYERVIEVRERVSLLKTAPSQEELSSSLIHKGITGEYIKVLEKPDLEDLERQLTTLKAETGLNSVAIVFLHSFTFPDHEIQVANLCKKIGFSQISMSHALAPMIKVVQRGFTASVDAYLTPLIKSYIEGFKSGFDDNFDKVDVSFMMSDGGLCPMDHFNGFRSILSGPAGGVVGYSQTGFEINGKQPMIGIDMGGTSTDVSRYDGEYEHVFETETAGVFIQAPQLAIETVAAGGGSRLFFRSGLFVVGPESSSAHPGPVCYRKNGYLAITDANLVLGRVFPEFFPHIFGPNEDQPLAEDLSHQELEKLTQQVNDYFKKHTSNGHKELTVDEVAYGFIRVANEAMCRPIRNITEAKGYDASTHILSVFGGAGPQHACAIAKNLGMKQIFIQRHCSILSAFGIGLADIVFEGQQPCNEVLNSKALEGINERLQNLGEKVKSNFKQQKDQRMLVDVKYFLNMRYDGTDTSMMIEKPHLDSGLEEECKAYIQQFEENYKREYGFLLSKRSIKIDDIRVRATGKSPALNQVRIAEWDGKTTPNPILKKPIYFEGGRRETPVYDLSDLYSGITISGPAVIIDNTTSMVIEPDCDATVTENGDLKIKVNYGQKPTVESGSLNSDQLSTSEPVTLDTIQLSVFAHRFMSIAEQMGRALERTSVSTNIKERRDFSCALFGPDGSLVANAPHLPVHLGSMQEAVKWQLNFWGDNWKDGEVIATNHPDAGGSHLPDITVITPVFVAESPKPVFFVASRGHHADIGGISPGSMPPFSTSLDEEGASFKYFKLVKRLDPSNPNSVPEFDEAGVTELLMAPAKTKRMAWETPCSGTRNLSDNISDLKAQIAANNKGIRLVNELINSYGLKIVHAYMKFIQQTAERAVRAMLTELSIRHSLKEVDTLHAVDYMDNGAKIQLKLTTDRRDGTAIFDFTGTDPQIYGNINAPKSVTMSAIIYSLRCMVKQDVPLNSGCLDPIQIIIPKHSFLDPAEGAAVVGGNVLTSQRVTDIVLMAFQAAANSQGCMNNFTFGDETMGYYETIAGGAGAGPTWQGQDAVQVHMTNTRITDPEILELRYPVLLREFSVREGSGGNGEHRGGHGVVREFEFLKDLTVGILSERRSFAPNGLNGGENGAKGRNTWTKGAQWENNAGGIVFLGGKNSIRVRRGDKVRIETPGGGGYGKAKTSE